MLFSSLSFLFVFLPITLFIYYIAKDSYKNYILLFASLVFYSWGEPKYIILMLLSIIINYFIALLIDKFRKHKKCILTLGIIVNIAIIFIFKYFNFFTSIVNNIFNTKIMPVNILLPLGISFYTFQILSYIIDVYRGEIKVQKNILLLATYISLFPQLIAGPIVRYSDVEKQLAKRKHNLEKFAEGIRKFILGLGKKVIIANQVAIISDHILNLASKNSYTGIILIIGIIAYNIQLYFDFSGYSDMAIGLGKMFGFDFLENFNYPYVSKSVFEFWKRWHISLGTWFKYYVYIPLGGSRGKILKTIRNLFIVWIIAGLWHGANWNFLILGIYYFIVIVIEKLLSDKLLIKIPRVIRWLFTIIAVFIGNFTTKFDDLESLLYVFKNVFKNSSFSINEYYYLINYIPYLLLGIILSFPIYSFINNKFNNNFLYVFFNNIFLMLILVVSICFLINQSYNPFIYFRF